jgi:preprotein translocase subunit SecB
MENNTETGFQVNRILLMDCVFNRIPNVTFDNLQITHNLDLSVNTQIDNNKIFVTVILNFNQSIQEIREVTCNIQMLGEFEKVGDVEIDLETFGKVNGAAIIYPYIREHLSSLSLKSGIGNIILPPANFVKLNSTKS